MGERWTAMRPGDRAERRRRRGPARWAPAVAVVAALAAGCSSGGIEGAAHPEGPTTTGAGDPVVLADLELASALQPFDACEDLLAHVKDQATQRVTAYGLDSGADAVDGVTWFEGGPARPSTGAPETTVPAATVPDAASTRSADQNAGAPAAGAGEAGTDHSTTNVQEEGVDEPDTVKADARRILAVVDNRLQYVDVTGDTPVVTGALDLPHAVSAQLLVDGDRVLVISERGHPGYGPAPMPGRVTVDSYPSPGSVPPEVTLTLVDAADPANLRVLTSVRIDGRSVSSRLVDGRARIVTTASPTALPFVYPSGPSGEETALETNRRIIAESTIDDWLPHVRTGTAADERELAVPCDAVRHPKMFSGFDVLTVQTVDLRGDRIVPGDATGIMASGQTVYASAENLYVATPSYVERPGFEPATSSGGSSGTAPGTTADSPGTEPEPSTTVVDPGQDEVPGAWEPPETTTSIHRFGITGDGPATYRSSGRVEGSLLNQFSMSEHDGRLRVATTDDWSGSGPPESWVRVLEERDGELVEVGAVGGLGKGEQIKSVRFIGDQGYVVTFRQTDPLYTIDLSDPTAPAVVGELKILGYSAYLHPAGDGLLIGIGQDATEQGRETGTQVALFDVSDPADPRQIQKHLVGVGRSAAEQDHHAFLWWAPTDLAVIPVQNYDEGWFRNGAIGYTITPDGITEVGFISHPPSFAGATPSPAGGATTTVVEPGGVVCDPVRCMPAPCPTAGRCWPGGGGDVTIQRALVIGERVYTVSGVGVLASNLTDLAAIGGADFDR